MKNRLLLLAVVLFLWSCDDKKQGAEKGNDSITKPAAPDYSKFPAFQADTAYSFIAKQVSFGPRIPNSKSADKCAQYLASKLKSYNLLVYEQSFEATGYDGKKLKGKNIIGSFNPKASKRIMLSAHWDTRPWSDEDAENPNGKLDGANDGASGVGVLLEIARLLQQDTSLKIGVDFVLFDLEDYGKPSVENSYCLGSQYWAKNRHVPNYSAYYGILLDMVGAKGARFNKEGHSMNTAPSVVARVWEVAIAGGYSEFFLHQMGGAITDDHYYVNKGAGIPTIDIIEYDPNKGFGEYWHTHNDNMSVIDTRTLKAVGQTLVNVLYTEAP